MQNKRNKETYSIAKERKIRWKWMDTKILQAPGLVGIAKIPTEIPNNWAL